MCCSAVFSAIHYSAFLGYAPLDDLEQSQRSEDRVHLLDPDSTIRLQAHCLCRVDVQLVIVEKEYLLGWATEVSEDMLEHCMRWFEVTDFVRQVVAVQQATESQHVTHIWPMHRIGIAQAGQGEARCQGGEELLDAGPEAFRPALEIVKECISGHGKAPFVHDARGEDLRGAASGL